MRARRLRRRRALALVTVALAAVLASLLAYRTDLLESQELSTLDTRFQVRGSVGPPDDFAVVAIDDRTFNELGVQWPFPRGLHGEVIDRLRQAGARVIAYDVQFTEPTTIKEDDALIGAIARARGKVVLATTEVGAGGTTRVLGGDSVLRQVGARPGYTELGPNLGDVVRQFRVLTRGLRNFAVVSVEAATGEAVELSTLGGDRTPWIDYRGPPETIPTYSFSQVLDGRVPAGAFRGRTVIVGASATALQDIHSVPTSDDELMSGPEILANSAWTVANGFPLRSSSSGFDILMILLLGGIPALLSWRFRVPVALGGAIALAAAYAVLAQLAFEGDWVISVLYPLLALAISAIGALVVTSISVAFERQWVHDTFTRFVPEAVVEDVLARTDENHRLGGVRRVCTVLFSDLRGFTTFSESMEPDRVVECLNQYMTEMSDAIMSNGGTLVSYLGDGIMAVFGAPMDQPDHADRALAATREMLDERLPRFNEWMRERGLGDGFQMGVGLNSGDIMTGQVGSEQRMEYTAIGDTVNSAARLEGMTKNTPHSVFLAESTKELLQGEGGLVYVDEMEVRGRGATIRIWTVSERS